MKAFLRRYITLSLAFFLSAFTCAVFAQKNFTVVIDAGHGGKDPGARGLISNEKDINLSIALKVGQKIKNQVPNATVYYTRSKDVFLTLSERSKFANDKKADLFISIHTNSSTNPAASGTETFSLGVAKTKENLEVAMTENSVILLEDDYKQTYQGFDPKSVESYIMFEFMQDKHMEQSISLASMVQSEFKKCNRKDRGVQQAGFWVLKTTAMPAVLVEVGFISNKEEEKYLNSAEGQDALANAIYKAFCSFKKDFEKKSSGAVAASGSTAKPQSATTAPAKPATAPKPAPQSTATESKPEPKPEPKPEQKPAATTSAPQKSSAPAVAESAKPAATTASVKNDDKIIYRVQIFVSSRKTDSNNPKFCGLNGVKYYYENNLYKYTYGETESSAKAQSLLNEAKKCFPDAFIVKFKNGIKIK